MRHLVAAALAAVALAACAPERPLEPPPPPPLEKITAAHVQVPRRGQLPPLVGQKQSHRIVPKETLLDVARDAGLGFNELQDANRSVDEWIPPPGQEVEVPTRWILPRTRQQGIVINVPEMRLYLFRARSNPGTRFCSHLGGGDRR